jgi:hypothetical protein
MEMVQEYEIQNIIFFPTSGEIMAKYLNNYK